MLAPRCRRAGPATASHACPSLLPPTLLAAPSTHLLIEALRRPLESPSTPRRSSRGSPASTTWSAPLAARRCGTTLRPNHSGPHSKSSSTTDTYGRPDSRQARSRRPDRTSLQPTQTPLDHRYHQPGRLRRQTHSDRTSRLTLCPTHGVTPSTPCA